LESFDDHSNFLRSRPRYAGLFELKNTDYKGWAHGLKKAGYATDPAYADRLIRIIEEFELHTYDLEGAALIAARTNPTPAAPPVPAARRPEITPPSPQPVAQTNLPLTKKEPEYNTAPAPNPPTTTASQVMASTSNIPVFESLRKSVSGKLFVPAVEPVNVFGERKVFVNNGASYIIARRGDTFKALSEELQLGYWQLPKYNELSIDERLKEGQKIYITPKRLSASVPYYTVREGDTVHSISQELGVKSRSICSLNGLQPDEPLKPGIRLSVAAD
jgi:LysM repeat protein